MRSLPGTGLTFTLLEHWGVGSTFGSSVLIVAFLYFCAQLQIVVSGTAARLVSRRGHTALLTHDDVLVLG